MIPGIGRITPFDPSWLSSFVEANKPMGADALKPVEIASGDIVGLSRTDAKHYTSTGQIGGQEAEKSISFESELMKAFDGVNADQNAASELFEQMVADPESVDAHEITIAMAKASMSLNIARSILDRIVRGWRDLINTR